MNFIIIMLYSILIMVAMLSALWLVVEGPNISWLYKYNVVQVNDGYYIRRKFLCVFYSEYRARASGFWFDTPDESYAYYNLKKDAFKDLRKLLSKEDKLKITVVEEF